MTALEKPIRQTLIEALTQSDEWRREGRVDRILWASEHQVDYGMIMGPMDTLALLNEARDCFVGGHYIAALMLAVAFIEHTLSDGISERPSGRRPYSLDEAIQIARSEKMFDRELLDRAQALKQIRNAFAHRKADEHPHSFPNRYREKRVHPNSILEADAKEALMVMYEFFRLTLKDA